MSPADLETLRARFARAMRAGDDAEAQQIAVILSDYEPPEDDRCPRTVDAWGTDR